jgi:hypothetical protein
MISVFVAPIYVAKTFNVALAVKCRNRRLNIATYMYNGSAVKIIGKGH